ncbi:MAG: ATP-binding protein [Verrucomicrobiota bacterium]
MKDASASSYSLVTRGARVQFAIGVALVSVIPLLALWYLSVLSLEEPIGSVPMTVIIISLLAASGVGGYMILRKYPVNIVRLRGYLEQMIDGELPEHVNLLKAEDDIAAVERCLKLVIEQLRERLEVLRAEKTSLQHQLYQIQKMESLGIMAAGVAHDFNNLLMGIMGNLSLMADQLEQGSSARANIRDMEMLTQRAAELTNQMLVYAGRGKFVMESVNVSKLVREMAELLKASVESGVHLKYALGENLPTVQADPTQLRQVVMNLVMNASDAIDENGGTITLSTSACQRGELDLAKATVNGKLPDSTCVCLEVVDTGCGIDSEKRVKIFDPFYSTKPKGRGLGLAVVLGIVLSHRGAISVESEPGKGTRFRILIPCSPR